MKDHNSTIQSRLKHDDSLLNRKYNVPGMSIYFGKENLEFFPGRHTPPFWTEDVETIFVNSGSLNVVVNGEETLVDTGELCFVKPGCVHYIVANESQEPCVFTFVLINESVFSDPQNIKRKYFDPIFHSINPNFAVYRRSAANYDELIALCRRLKICLNPEAPAHELLTIALCHEYLYLIWAELGAKLEQPAATNDAEADTFRKILDYIYLNSSAKISIADLCEIGGVARNQLFNLFAKYIGETPAQCITGRRLGCAKAMLRDTDKPIAQIALECGFAHQSHFGNLFMKRFGVTPLAYRKTLGEIDGDNDASVNTLQS